MLSKFTAAAKINPNVLMFIMHHIFHRFPQSAHEQCSIGFTVPVCMVNLADIREDDLLFVFKMGKQNLLQVSKGSE